MKRDGELISPRKRGDNSLKEERNEPEEIPTAQHEDVIKFSWFFFDLIIKSVTLFIKGNTSKPKIIEGEKGKTKK